MVYESDYYTSRRPYSRPSVSSYTVTTLNHTATPGLGKAQTFHRTIPFVAHKRLTTNNAPPHSNRVRPSTMFAEMSRIQRRVRPAIGSKPVEDFLNTHAVTAFDDETHLIRAQTNALLKKIHAPIPRTQKPLFSPNRYDEIQAVPITSDSYIQRMLGPVRNVQQDILSMSHYNEPAKGYIGKGHLACVTFAGGRPISRRRNRVLAEDDRVKDDVKFLSYYDKTRTAANGPYYQPRGATSKTCVTKGQEIREQLPSGFSIVVDNVDAGQDLPAPESETEKQPVREPTPEADGARVKQIQAEAETRKNDFAQLLEEHAQVMKELKKAEDEKAGSSQA